MKTRATQYLKVTSLITLGLFGFGEFAMAQTTTTDAQGNVTTTTASDKYGAGGSEASTSNKNYQVTRDRYYDKCGRIREDYSYDPATKTGYRTYWTPAGSDVVIVKDVGGVQSYSDYFGKALSKEEGQALVKKWESTPSPPPPCPEKKETTGGGIKIPSGKLESLIQDGQVKVDIKGTGETIGHVADLEIENLTDQPVNGSIPATVVESKNRYQDYVCPKGQDFALGPHETKTVTMDGTCLERDRNPEPKGQTGDLVVNDGGPDEQNLDRHIRPDVVRRIISVTEAKYEAVDKLEKQGAFKDFPYRDPQERKNIAIQWSTWEDPQISDLVGSPPADKQDFKKTIDDQAKRHGPISRDTRKKLDKGTDSMWDGIELTSEKAKDLEPTPSPGTLNVSDEDEAKKTPDEVRKEKKKDWKTKEKLYYKAGLNLAVAAAKYNSALKTYCRDHSKEYKDLIDKRDKAEKSAKAEKATQADQEALKQAEAALAKLQAELEKDFVKTPEGKQLAEEADKASKEVDKAKTDMDNAKNEYDKANNFPRLK